MISSAQKREIAPRLRCIGGSSHRTWCHDFHSWKGRQPMSKCSKLMHVNYVDVNLHELASPSLSLILMPWILPSCSRGAHPRFVSSNCTMPRRLKRLVVGDWETKRRLNPAIFTNPTTHQALPGSTSHCKHRVFTPNPYFWPRPRYELMKPISSGVKRIGEFATVKLEFALSF